MHLSIVGGCLYMSPGAVGFLYKLAQHADEQPSSHHIHVGLCQIAQQERTSALCRPHSTNQIANKLL